MRSASCRPESMLQMLRSGSFTSGLTQPPLPMPSPSSVWTSTPAVAKSCVASGRRHLRLSSAATRAAGVFALDGDGDGGLTGDGGGGDDHRGLCGRGCGGCCGGKGFGGGKGIGSGAIGVQGGSRASRGNFNSPRSNVGASPSKFGQGAGEKTGKNGTVLGPQTNNRYGRGIGSAGSMDPGKPKPKEQIADAMKKAAKGLESFGKKVEKIF